MRFCFQSRSRDPKVRPKGQHTKIAKTGGVDSVRGTGLLLAVELAAGIDAKVVYTALLERGIVTNAVTATALRLAPPLTVTTEQIDEAVAALTAVLQETPQ